MKTVKIIKSKPPQVTISAGVCDTFLTKFIGLMFRRQIDPHFGLIFSEKSESRLNTAIHMFFMNFDITVLWLNSDFIVVDKTLAKKWHPMYVPKKNAKYTLELHIKRFVDYSIGDKLQVVNDA